MSGTMVWVVAGLAALAVFALLRGLYIFFAAEFGVTVDERLLGSAWRELQKRRRAQRGRPLWERLLSRVPVAQQAERQLEQAGVALRTGEWMGLWLLTTVGAAALGYLVTRAWITAVLMAALGAVAPPVWLNWRIAERRAKFADQLVDTLRLIIGALQAGHGLLQAVQLVAEEMPAPTSEEFQQVIREVALGFSLNEALERLGERMANEELNMVVTAVRIQSEVGGSLAEVLENIVDTIEERVRLEGEVRALTAQQRMSALIITGLPFFLALVISLVNPEYLMPLFAPEWRWLPLLALAMMLVGQLVMRRLLRIDY